MSDNEISRRLENLEAQAQDTIRRIEELSHKIERFEANPHHNVEQIAGDLSRLWTIVIELFPEAILIPEISIVIPGVAGTGEVGPGNVQYPDYSPSTGAPNELPMHRRKRMFGME